MKSETISLSNDRLVGEWHHHKPATQLIIICHGFKDTSENPTLVAIANGLNKHGHDTFAFNFSKNTGGFDIKHQVQDIAKIVEHFNRYDQIVLLAASFGALTAAIATIQIPKVAKLITLNGFFGTGQLGDKHRKSYVKFRIAATALPKFRRILTYYKRELRPAEISVPTLVVHTQVDESVSIEQSRTFYEQLTATKHFITLKTANHGITAPADRDAVISKIDRWLAK